MRQNWIVCVKLQQVFTYQAVGLPQVHQGHQILVQLIGHLRLLLVKVLYLQ